MSITVWLGQVITIIVLVGGAFVSGIAVGDSHKGGRKA
jgi:hypothetical protein